MTEHAMLRRRTIGIAVVVLVLGTVHFVDHVVRGQLVHSRQLDATWNHSGWPFQSQFSPFTGSLITVYGLLFAGIALTRRDRLRPGYWLAVAIVILGIVIFVHFVPGPGTETPAVIMNTYDQPWIGIPAVVNVFLIAATLIVMAVNAVYVARESGRWW